MTQRPMRILLVEDSPSDALLLRETLSRWHHPGSEVQVEELLDDGLRRLGAEAWDLLLLDLGLPDSQGLETLKRALPAAGRTPVVVMTGLDDERVGLEALQMGAQDFLVKGQLDGPTLVRAMRHAIERKRAGQHIRDLVSSVPGVVWESSGPPDGEHQITFVSEHAEAMLGYPLAAWSAQGFWQRVVHPDDQQSAQQHAERVWRSEEPVSARYRLRRKDGRSLWVESRSLAIRDEQGRPQGLRGVLVDVSEGARATARLDLLARIGVELGTSLDLQATLGSAARMLVPAVADWCVIHLLEGDELVVGEVVHVDEGRVRWAAELQTSYPPRPEAPAGAWEVIRSGKARLFPHVTTDHLVAVAQDEAHLCLLQEVGMCSAVLAPLTAHGAVLGVVTLVSCRPDLRYDEHDLALAEEVGRRLAVALENARLYRDAREAGEALAEEKERLAVTLRSIGDGVIATDAEGRVRVVNEVAERLTGWTQAEATGRSIAEVFAVSDRQTGEPIEDPVARILATGERADLPGYVVLRARDGATRLIADSASPIRDGSGALLGAVVAFRDVTVRERLEAELQRAHTLDSLGQLAGGIAHDFNNLLTAILANLSIARARVADPDALAARLADAERASLRARDLTRQLLAFAQGGAPIRKTVALSSIIKDSASFVLRGTAVRPRYQVAADLWDADVDPVQISQVVQNLVINGQQAMSGGGELQILLSNEQIAAGQGLPLVPGRYVRLEVIDHGHGIDPEQLPRIFDPFYSTRDLGTGLGLAITYAIVRKHGGHISASSVPGNGATFTVYLPAASARAAKESPRKARKPFAGNGRVLVMDDDAAVRQTLSHLLEALGYEVSLASEGGEAVEACRRALAQGHPFGLVFLDLTVAGGMGGLQAAQAIKALSPATRLVVSSGYSEDQAMARYQDHGFAGVLAKPYTLEELEALLRGLDEASP